LNLDLGETLRIGRVQTVFDPGFRIHLIEAFERVGG